MVIILKAVWHYRGFISGLVKRDFQSKYLNSVLGSIWVVLNPIALIIVYTVIFSQVMGTRMPNSNSMLSYSIYLCAGLLPWQFFSETITRMQNVFIEQSGIMKKVSFPRTSLPLYIMISSFLNFVIIYSLFILFLIITGNFPGLIIVQVIPLLCLQQLFALSIGILLATLNVFFRDIGHTFAIVLQFWSWLTPLVYTIGIIPNNLKWIFDWNIMIPITNGYHSIFLDKNWDGWNTLWPIFIVSIFLLLLGYFLFKKLDKEMVDEL
ncbi:ABC transporter permease [Paenibacillus radicis (ex Xue et al. 2023)]|uniref:Transport permease protein n=1 Tax=Paenibacillus radicis (ex Xue et al. 2023) TaxID=2972489 RepID=A0ABT1YS14_9BACL|nr:ABC transporter permease [Paenibacillus radicis (ex Xue et al. 2023)]MCR8635974.1 ABC transporter permease [Paenibacillus radicis (ex Xue et al. 2023)]